MKYKVHRLEIKAKSAQDTLDTFINSLAGDVISIVPIVNPTFRPMGATSITSQLLIVEQIKKAVDLMP